VVLLAPAQDQEAVLQFAQVAGGQPVAGQRRFAQVTGHARTEHPDFAVLGPAQFDMRQGWPTLPMRRASGVRKS
jgi:hypothetical protein